MTRSITAFALAIAAAIAIAIVPPSPISAGQKGKLRPKAKAVPVPAPPAKPQTATPIESLKVAKGFKVELLYSVPKDVEGSWVNMCVDPKGRLIVSDQYGALYRVTPPPVGQTGEIKLEKIQAQIGMAQGLLWAFDALYVVVNGKGSGLYRVTDSNGDDMPDKVELLREFQGGGGEHGPHAVLLHPDGKRLTVVCGNQTKLTKYDTTRVPPIWGEDHLLPRLPDGNNFMKGVLGPGGAIYNVSPDGKTWELFSAGFRNEFDAGYNRDGELFTYDADMEWDFNTPWYRPTRVCHVTSGSEWGWRNGAGKYPVHYPETLPPVVDVGPGSPTGVCFGYGAKFPAKYQDAFFICDWSYGKLYAVHMTPKGSTYTGTLEEFVAGTPLPLTDVVVNPTDGAMYFTIGGRKTQSGLYRVTYTGSEPTAPATARALPPGEFAVRHSLEALHGKDDPDGLVAAWKYLGHEDRFIRYAARVAVEHRFPSPNRTFNEKDPRKAITALLAFVREMEKDPFHRTADEQRFFQTDEPGKKVRAENRKNITEALDQLDFGKLPTDLRIDLLRVYQIFYNRFGPLTEEERTAAVAKLDPLFPTGSRFVDSMLLEILVYLQDDKVASKAMKLLAEAPTQEEQIEYVRSLRMLKAGWTPELRKQYAEWFPKAANYKGGNSFQGFLRLIKEDVKAGYSPQEKAAYEPILNAQASTTKVAAAPPRPFVKKWTLEEVAPIVDKGLKAGGRDFDRGRKLFGAASCFACHRFDNEGGSNGPDLSGVAGRFSVRDLLESVIDPSKEVSDQYGATEFVTVDGRVVVGRVINLNGDNISVNTDMLNPGGVVSLNRNNIERMQPSKTSMMPAGLLDTFKEDEIVDLMAYLLSRGDRGATFFKK